MHKSTRNKPMKNISFSNLQPLGYRYEIIVLDSLDENHFMTFGVFFFKNIGSDQICMSQYFSQT